MPEETLAIRPSPASHIAGSASWANRMGANSMASSWSRASVEGTSATAPALK